MANKPRTGRLGGFELLAQEASDHAYRAVMEMRDCPFGDSPIEHLLFAALVTVARQNHRCITNIGIVDPTVPLEVSQRGEWMMGGNINNTAFVEKQVQVAGWRVDFLIRYPSLTAGIDENGFPLLDRLIVECDGHAFHERTKEQAARDRSRDRVAQLEGIPVLRFTGSEIWNDPSGCADEILAFMERA